MVNDKVSPDTVQDNTARGHLDQHFLHCVTRNRSSAGLDSFCRQINVRSFGVIKIKVFRIEFSQLFYHLDDGDDSSADYSPLHPTLFMY